MIIWDIDNDMEVISGWTEDTKMIYFGARFPSSMGIRIEVYSETNTENKKMIAEFKQKKNEIKK